METTLELLNCAYTYLRRSVIDTSTLARELIDGFSGLRPQATEAIKRFLAEYLGNPDEPTPFGGRTDELAALDRWLDDPAAPPYAVLTAPVGRGKSAILTQC